MTKTKSKKMTKSTFAIIIMAVVMVAMLAFGGTYAYFTASTSAKSTNFTTGKVVLTNSGAEISVISDKVVPGDTIISEAISYTNGSDVNTYIAVVMTVKKGTNSGDAEEVTDLSEISGAINLGVTASWQQCETSTNVYIAKGANFAVSPSGDPIAFTTGAVTFNVDEHYTDGTSELGAGTWEGVYIEISFQAYQVQAEHAKTDQDTTLSVSAEDAANAEKVWTAMKYMLDDNYVGA